MPRRKPPANMKEARQRQATARRRLTSAGNKYGRAAHAWKEAVKTTAKTATKDCNNRVKAVRKEKTATCNTRVARAKKS